MYANHFGLTGEPFSLTPDPAFLYLSPGHAEALAALEVGLLGRRGLMVMTGEVGTGKTTLLYSLLSRIHGGIRTAYIANTKLSFDDLLRLALADFGVPLAGSGRVDLLNALNAFLHQCARDDITAALVVDEAQNLEDDAFENVRLLSNFETFTAKLLQIVLVGQPELEAKLQQPQLRQVAERIAVRCHVNPLGRAESRKYLAHRLEHMEGSTDLFTPAAVRLLVTAGRGIPRRLNILAHNALLFTYGRGAARVTRRCVRAAIKEKSGRGLVVLDRRVVSTPFTARRTWRRSSLAAAGLLTAASVAATVWWRDPERAAPATADLLAEPAAAANTAPFESTHSAVPVVVPAAGTIAIPAANVADVVPPPADRDGAAPAPAAVTDSTTITQVAAVQMTTAAEPSLPTPKAPPRVVRVTSGATLEVMVKQIYGSANPDLIARVRSLNPQITNPDRIIAGDTLLFPQQDHR